MTNRESQSSQHTYTSLVGKGLIPQHQNYTLFAIDGKLKVNFPALMIAPHVVSLLKVDKFM